MYCIVQLPLSMSTRGPAWLQSKQQQQPAASVPAQPPMSTPSQASPSTTSTASQAHHAHLAVMATPPLDGSNGPHKDHTDLPPHAAHMPTHPVRTPGPCTIAVYVCLFVAVSLILMIPPWQTKTVAPVPTFPTVVNRLQFTSPHIRKDNKNRGSSRFNISQKREIQKLPPLKGRNTPCMWYQGSVMSLVIPSIAS